MNRIVWTHLDTTIIVAISIMMLGMTGLAVHAKEKKRTSGLGRLGPKLGLVMPSEPRAWSVGLLQYRRWPAYHRRHEFEVMANAR